MFDMLKVGRNIAKLRGQTGITQMGLADKLGISYQAVSNWERGTSMPDIAKLPQLAEIFDVSIEEILEEGKGSRLITSMLGNKTGEYLQQHEISVDELSGVAPLLNMEQIGEVFEQVKDKVSLRDLLPLAPFLSDEVLDECARKAMEGGTLSDLVPLASFLSDEVLDECARKAMEGGTLSDLVPLASFLSDELLNECAQKVIDSGNISDLVPLAPFLDSDIADVIALRMFAK